MGGSNSTIRIDHRVWPAGTTHETYSNIFNREDALSSYLKKERLSFGKVDPNILRDMYNDNFLIIDKGQNYYDGSRSTYSDPPECCTTDQPYIKKYNVVLSCSDSTKTFDSDKCDDVMFNTCTTQSNNKCTAWIRAQVERKGKYFDQLAKISADYKIRNDPYVIAFIEALRDFAADGNNYNTIADQILDSYPPEIQNSEYKCAYPSSYIIEQEKRLQTPKECWYKECALVPLYKLRLSNIRRRDMCTITICDIDIKTLNMSVQDLQIICKNKYTNKSINILRNDPIRQDKENLFFIPEFKNTIFPLYLIFSLCFIFNK